MTTKQFTLPYIRQYFNNTDLPEKFFDYFCEYAKRIYEELQQDTLDDDTSTDDDNNVDSSLDITKDYMVEYAAQVEQGHSHEWSAAYADYVTVETNETSAYHAYCMVIDIDKEQAERELDTYIKNIDDDPVFVERYKFLLREPHTEKQAKEYTEVYHSCIEDGKSKYYAHAYADAVNLDYNPVFCEIQAEAYEIARMKGMYHSAAFGFAETLSDAYDCGVICETDKILRFYHEPWQREYLFNLLVKEWEESNERKAEDWELKELRGLVM